MHAIGDIIHNVDGRFIVGDTGLLPCDGRAVSAGPHPRLYALLHGAGLMVQGAVHLPDFRSGLAVPDSEALLLGLEPWQSVGKLLHAPFAGRVWP